MRAGLFPSLWLAARPNAVAVVTIDRIEGDFAVVEWSESLLSDVPLSVLPKGVAEGDRIVVEVSRRRPTRPRFAAILQE